MFEKCLPWLIRVTLLYMSYKKIKLLYKIYSIPESYNVGLEPGIQIYISHLTEVRKLRPGYIKELVTVKVNLKL